MPMSHEVRYLGRELVRFFGQKGGKWVSQQVLSVITAIYSALREGGKRETGTEGETAAAVLLAICAAVSLLWVAVTVALTFLLIDREKKEKKE